MSDQFEQKPSIDFKEIKKAIPEKESREKIWGGQQIQRSIVPKISGI